MQTIKDLCDTVRETAYAIHTYHGHGHLVQEICDEPKAAAQRRQDPKLQMFSSLVFLRSLRSFAANKYESGLYQRSHGWSR